jgi:hypothetical protein
LNKQNDDDDLTLNPEEITVHDKVLNHADRVTNVEEQH